MLFFNFDFMEKKGYTTEEARIHLKKFIRTQAKILEKQLNKNKTNNELTSA
jgi:hypothetical protein